jgi:hypothetical protein
LGFHPTNATINSSGSSNYTILHSHHSDHHLHGLGTVLSCYETVLSTTLCYAVVSYILCCATFIRSIFILFIFLYGICVLGLECLKYLLIGSRSPRGNYRSQHEKTRHDFPLGWLRIVQSISEYRTFCLFFNASKLHCVGKFIGNTVSTGIGLVTVMISSGFATMRFFHVVPMPYYLIFSLAMVVFIVGVFVWFPCALIGNDLLKEVKRNWCSRLDVFPVPRMKFVKRVGKGVKVEVLTVMLGDYVFSEFDRST